MNKKVLLIAAVSVSLTACSGTRPDNLGVTQGKLKTCPSSPNCVSSFDDKSDETHYIAPVTAINEKAWQQFKQKVEASDFLKLVESRSDYLYLEETSDLMKFVDDLEIYWDRSSDTVHFRSASRIGYGDWGVNRERVEKLKALF